jgi:electron transfer flavoprotein beta subunit
MRIVSILGRALDPSGLVVNRRVGRIFVNRKEYILQPADRCALEAALRIKDGAAEADTDVEVVALPRDLTPDDDVLRQALATGADRAAYLPGNDTAADVAGMARLLAAAVENLGGVDLVLLGATTLDTGQTQLGPRMAEILGWPQITDAWQVGVAEAKVQAVYQKEAGYVTLEADLPAVVTLVPGVLKPRYPDGVRLINIYKREGEIAEALEQWDLADLVDLESLAPLVERRGQDFPPERELGVRPSGNLEEQAQAVAQALQRWAGGEQHG